MAAAAAGLTFSVANPGGVNVAGMLALRGSDPSITIAPGHPYLTWRPNARYAVPAGALAGQALSLSTISAGVGGAIGVGPAAGAAQALLVLINPPGPAVLDRVCRRLVAEGFPMVAYETDGALCTAVLSHCARLDASGAAPHLDYALLPGDVYACQLLGGPAAYQAMVNSITYGSLASTSTRLPDLPILLWFAFGLGLSAARDGVGSPCRVAIEAMDAAAAAAGMAGARISQWLAAARMPAPLIELREEGVGLTRRQSELAELVVLERGVPASVRPVLQMRLVRPTLRNSLTVFGRRILAFTSAPVMALTLADDGLRELTDSAAAQITGYSSLLALERRASAPEIAGALDRPALAGVSDPTLLLNAMIDQHRLDKRGAAAAGGAGVGAGAAAGAPGALRASARGVTAAYDDRLKVAMMRPAFHAFEASLGPIAAATPFDLRTLFMAYTAAPVLAVRRMALGLTDAPASRSDTLLLLRSKFTWDALDAMVSRAVLTVLSAPVALVLADASFRLPSGVSRKMLEARCDEYHWVMDVVRPAQAWIQRPAPLKPLDLAEAYLDTVELQRVITVATELSTIMGFPLAPPAGAVANWFSLPMIFNEAKSLAEGLASRDDAFRNDDARNLLDFTNDALREAARHIRSRFHDEDDPDGGFVGSVLPPDAGCIGKLADMRNARTGLQAQMRSYPAFHGAMQSWMSRHGPQDDTRPPLDDATGRRSARSRESSRSPSRATSRPSSAGGVSRPSSRATDERGRSLERDRGRGRSLERDRSQSDRSRSPRGDRSRSPRASAREGDAAAPRVKENAAGDGFFYIDRQGAPRSRTYYYAPCEAYFGRSREDCCYPFLFSNRASASQRLGNCLLRHKAAHAHESSPAHVADKDKLAWALANREHFAKPTA